MVPYVVGYLGDKAILEKLLPESFFLDEFSHSS